MAQRQFRSDDTSKWPYGYGIKTDGAKTVSSNSNYDGANAGCSGTSGTKALTLDAASTFANGDLVLIHQSRGSNAGAWELNKITSGGGTTSVTLALPLTNTYVDSGADQAQIIELKQYSAVTVDSAKTWSAPAWDGSKGGILAFVCNGTVTVTGSISATGKGYVGGQAVGPHTVGYRGEGTAAASAQQHSTANGNGGGGGNQSSGGGAPGGSGGGNGTAGSAAAQGNNSPGSTAGNAGLTVMVFGGGGGGGGGADNGTSGAGGTGGGIIVIIAKTITVTGSVVSGGNVGANWSGSGSNGSGGGGAGAGGSILFKGFVLSLGTSNQVSAPGNSGGDGEGGWDGGGSGVGRIHADYKTSITATTSPTIDSRQDKTLLKRGGGAAMLMQL